MLDRVHKPSAFPQWQPAGTVASNPQTHSERS